MEHPVEKAMRILQSTRKTEERLEWLEENKKLVYEQGPDQFMTVDKKVIDFIYKTWEKDLKGFRILDACCGLGFLTYKIPGVTYLDVSRENVDFCKKHIQHGDEFICGDFLKHKGLYDMVIINPPFSRLKEFVEHAIHLSLWQIFMILPSGHKLDLSELYESGIKPMKISEFVTFQGKKEISCNLYHFVIRGGYDPLKLEREYLVEFHGQEEVEKYEKYHYERLMRTPMKLE